jgi:hypothetical protein
MVRIARYVGLDVHNDTVAVASCDGGPGTSAKDYGTNPQDLPRLMRKLASLAPLEHLRLVYEAGLTGFGLCRALRDHGVSFSIVTPNRVPKMPGPQIQTDKRDARHFAWQLRMTIIAMARGVLGFMWSIGQHVEQRTVRSPLPRASTTRRTAEAADDPSLMEEGILAVALWAVESSDPITPDLDSRPPSRRTPAMRYPTRASQTDSPRGNRRTPSPYSSSNGTNEADLANQIGPARTRSNPSPHELDRSTHVTASRSG